MLPAIGPDQSHYAMLVGMPAVVVQLYQQLRMAASGLAHAAEEIRKELRRKRRGNAQGDSDI